MDHTLVSHTPTGPRTGRGGGKTQKDTGLVPLQRALSGAGRRVSRSTGTIPLEHLPIVEVGVSSRG